jgi:hypothetical protein
MQLHYIHKESIPPCSTVLFFVGQFPDMFRTDLIGHLLGDFYNVRSVRFNLTIRVFTCD